MAEEISNQQSLGYIDFVPADFDFAALMAELRTSYERKSSERGLSLDFPAQELEAVNGDYQLPRESLEIFLDNALDASDSGAVYFSVSKPSENEYKFEVRDGGPGLSAEALAHIFEPFHKEKGEGGAGVSGLKLAISDRKVAIWAAN